MKEIKLVILSGKGGVGKSMLASSLAMLFARERRTVAVDCDVDAPNLAIWLGDPGNWREIKKISVSERAIIDDKRLTKKEKEECLKKCRFNALEIKDGRLKVNPFLCEGCGACEIFCPKGVVRMKPVKNAQVLVKKTRYGFPLVSGQLFPGETGSGKIVTEIKKEAERIGRSFRWHSGLQSKPMLYVIDSAPGTGCPVTASLRDSNLAILLTEPTPSGFSDLKRVLGVVNYFNIPWALVINKWDINRNLSEKIEKWAGIKLLGKISYDKKIFRAVANLKPILKTELEAKREIKEIFKKVKKLLAKNFL